MKDAKTEAKRANTRLPALLKHSFVPSCRRGRLVRNSAGATRVLMALPHNARSADIIAYAADCTAREDTAPQKRVGVQGIVPFMADVFLKLRWGLPPHPDAALPDPLRLL